jgi:hypothetical protein
VSSFLLPVCCSQFRSSEYIHDSHGSRDLTKRYGFRLLIFMGGVGSRFDVGALLTAIGAGIGLLSIATLVADFIATKLLANRVRYTEVKYEEVTIKDPKLSLSPAGLLHTLTHIGRVATGHSHKRAEDGSEDPTERHHHHSHSSADEEDAGPQRGGH